MMYHHKSGKGHIMTDDAYKNAIKRRNELLSELKEVELFISLYQRFIGTKEGETEPLYQPSIFGDDMAKPDSVEPAPHRKKRRGNPGIIADAAERIIRESGRPMVRGEIAEALEAGGIEIPSGDKARYVGTVLWRQSDRFENLEGEGYWIKGVPRPSS